MLRSYVALYDLEQILQTQLKKICLIVSNTLLWMKLLMFRLSNERRYILESLVLHLFFWCCLSGIQTETYGMCVRSRLCWTQNALPSGRRRVCCLRSSPRMIRRMDAFVPDFVPKCDNTNIIFSNYPLIWSLFFSPRVCVDCVHLQPAITVAPRVALALRNRLQEQEPAHSRGNKRINLGKRKGEIDSEVGKTDDRERGREERKHRPYAAAAETLRYVYIGCTGRRDWNGRRNYCICYLICMDAEISHEMTKTG